MEKVPNLLGLTKGKAIKVIHRAGLKYKITDYQYSSKKENTVIAQKQKPGSKLKKGKYVGIIISAGKKPVPTKRPVSTKAPAPTKKPYTSPVQTPRPPKNPIGGEPIG